MPDYHTHIITECCSFNHILFTGLPEMDPKLKEAYIKMRKLDKILKKKVKKERRVKRDRLLLERRCEITKCSLLFT